MWTRAYWQAVAERTIWTFAQSLAAALTVLGATGLLTADWKTALSTAGLAAVFAFLKSIGVNLATGNGPSSLSVESVTSPITPGRHER